MKINNNIMTGLILLAIILSACTDSVQNELTAPEQSQHNTQLSVVEAKTSPDIELETNEVDANLSFNKFGLRFFDIVCKQMNGNVAVSPVSTGFLLTMMANACDDDYAKSVCNAMGCDNVSSLNTLCNKLMMYLPDESHLCDMSIANSIWHAPYLSPTNNFIRQMNEKYYADVHPLDFDLLQAADTINLWVDTKTRGLINELVTYRMIRESEFIALNALYFNGGWQNRFNKDYTHKATFFGTDKQSEVDFMNMSDELTYCKSDLGEWVYLPYAGNSYNLVIALPDKKSSINEFLQSFEASYLSSANSLTWPDNITVDITQVGLSLPKFSISTELFCEDYFKEMGLNLKTQGFKELVGQNGELNREFRILNKTIVNIDEEGSSAASASVNITITSGGENNPAANCVDFKLDRPFIYFVCNSKTGSIIIAGKVANL